VRILTFAVLMLALSASAAIAKPFGKPRTLGTTPIAYDYSSLFSADGPHGGVAIYATGEKQVGLKITQRLFITRIEGNGRTHGVTTTPARAPGRYYDGGPPYLDLAVGPHWRMLTEERRATRTYGIFDTYGVQIAPNGHRVAAHRVGPDSDASPFFNTNSRGDAIAAFGDGFSMARAAGRFVRAPKALRKHGDFIPDVAADGSLYEWRVTANDGRSIARSSSGRRWGRAQSVSSRPGVDFHEMASSPAGDALLVYGTGDGLNFTTIIARWSRRGHAFGPPVNITTGLHADPFSVSAEAIPHGGFAVLWRDADGGVHLVRASRPGGPFRGALSWTPPKSSAFGTMLPLRDGRTVVVWEIHDPDLVKPDKLKAAVINANRKVGPAQTIAVSARNLGFGIALRRLGGNRAALVWTERQGKKKRIRVAFTRR
jgi:hypothetical protein